MSSWSITPLSPSLFSHRREQMRMGEWEQADYALPSTLPFNRRSLSFHSLSLNPTCQLSHKKAQRNLCLRSQRMVRSMVYPLSLSSSLAIFSLAENSCLSRELPLDNWMSFSFSLEERLTQWNDSSCLLCTRAVDPDGEKPLWEERERDCIVFHDT